MKWADEAARQVWIPLVGPQWAEARVGVQRRMMAAALSNIASLVLALVFIAVCPLVLGLLLAGTIELAALTFWSYEVVGLFRLGRSISFALRSRGLMIDSVAPMQNVRSFLAWQNRNRLSAASFDGTR